MEKAGQPLTVESECSHMHRGRNNQSYNSQSGGVLDEESVGVWRILKRVDCVEKGGEWLLFTSSA